MGPTLIPPTRRKPNLILHIHNPTHTLPHTPIHKPIRTRLPTHNRSTHKSQTTLLVKCLLLIPPILLTIDPNQQLRPHTPPNPCPANLLKHPMRNEQMHTPPQIKHVSMPSSLIKCAQRIFLASKNLQLSSQLI